MDAEPEFHAGLQRFDARELRFFFSLVSGGFDVRSLAFMPVKLVTAYFGFAEFGVIVRQSLSKVGIVSFIFVLNQIMLEGRNFGAAKGGRSDRIFSCEPNFIFCIDEFGVGDEHTASALFFQASIVFFFNPPKDGLNQIRFRSTADVIRDQIKGRSNSAISRSSRYTEIRRVSKP